MIVNLPEYAADVAELFGGPVPILQDTLEEQTANLYGAAKWYVYLIDREGNPRYVHYEIDLATERDRLLGEIATLVAE